MSLLTKWTSTTRWNPFKELETFEKNLAQFFDRPPTSGNGENPIAEALWEPATDIAEDDQEFLVKVEVPDMKKEDIKVTVENGALCISGERKAEKEEKTRKYHRVERSYGSFAREFALPEGVDGTKINADYKDGVLKVHVPKVPGAAASTVQIKVA